MNIYLIRHGESLGNLTGKIQGWKDYPLSELGIRQAQALANRFDEFPLDMIYSSDLSRAYETAKALGESVQIPVQTWEKVREINLGPLQGLTREEILKKYPVAKERSILTTGVLGTESVSEISYRCQEVIEHLLRLHENETVAIVSHGGFISIFLMYIIAGEQWHQLHRPFQIGNTSITRVEWMEGKKPIIHYVNELEHIAASNLISSRSSML